VLIENAGFTFSQVKSQSVSSSTMLQGKVNKKNSTIGKKEAFDKGKENATRKLTVNKNCNEEGVLARGILKSQKTREHNRQHKDDKAGSAALTILVFLVNFTILLFCSLLKVERILVLEFC
jgi:hypothetical protein